MSRNKKNTNKQSNSNQISPRPKPGNTSDQPVLVPASEPKGPLPHVATTILPGTNPVQQRLVAVRQERTSFNGPIPHPDIFKKYGEVIPDAPERILRVFEEDSKHSREMQSKALDAQKGDNRRVHWMAYSLIAGGYVMSAVFALMDKDWLAGIVLTTTIVGTVTGFLQSRKDASSALDTDEEEEK